MFSIGCFVVRGVARLVGAPHRTMKFYGDPVQDEQMEPQRSDLLPGTSLPTTEELRGPEGSLKTLL